mgnify:CR=1 FL=1
MKCQALYDLREKFEFCSGSELSEFFRKETKDPSPSGITLIPQKAGEFVGQALEQMAYNSPSVARQIWGEMKEFSWKDPLGPNEREMVDLILQIPRSKPGGRYEYPLALMLEEELKEALFELREENWAGLAAYRTVRDSDRQETILLAPSGREYVLRVSLCRQERRKSGESQ